MKDQLTFSIKRIGFDEHYSPSNDTRLTTNFANLARGERRQENLRRAINMINNNFNARANWDNPNADRYAVELDIVHVDVDVEGNGKTFPTIEILKTAIVDHKTNKRIEGIVGNNFSSYVRDYDFSVVLLEHNKGKPDFSAPEGYGDLHGKMFQAFVKSAIYQQNFSKLPVMCLSVSDNKTYHRTANSHPILGVEYVPNEPSLTENYFKKMGMEVRYFMPPNSVAPYAFYFFGDLLTDYTNLELISTLSTMETFQKIYRPEIYNANAYAGDVFKPSLKHEDYSLTRIVYDREERSRLAIEQGKWAQEHFIKPYQTLLTQWAANYA
ncbi:MAG: hypothetical protein B7Z05_01295 [Thiotrichales bacterium 32-46-8]|nr:DUF1852 domain-containing protein [Gammaproteobacteria bacterium]OYX07528.1 MAG: hypothetical protein B7Z05_01295 [Thiotrichales bacterium 32-46-8]OYZ06445.1 MAG: hypothetical protein B7Y29_05595 [Thiotrichales bacterium 16-46-22]OZA17230.1 MAG: hypothetical protein B7X85_05365 [Thiotrichales bacterium 17-46-47]OZA97879.1 MAG: hypothetical protein B7X52_01715 [Thiotrichales bacterium 34-46-19]OZB86660.1 MAG: hypothetical protein B7Z48_03800 [Thiotrichales bacterium 12-47-6]UCG19460.1 MAG: 